MENLTSGDAVQRHVIQPDRPCSPRHQGAEESCSTLTEVSLKASSSAHKLQKNGGIHFPVHLISIKRAKSFLHIHQDGEDSHDAASDKLKSIRKQVCDRSFSDHEDHLHTNKSDDDTAAKERLSKRHGRRQNGVKRRASKLKSSMDKSYGDIHQLVKSVEAKMHPTSHCSAPNSIEDITKPSTELARAWRAFHHNKGHKFPQDWVRPIMTREYTHCSKDEEILSHDFCDCCQKPHCERSHFFENLAHPFQTLVNMFGAHKEELPIQEKFEDNQNSTLTFSSIFGQTEELLPLVSEFPVPIDDIFCDQDCSCEFEFFRNFGFCKQKSFKSGKGSFKSPITQPFEIYSWDLMPSSTLKESKSLLSIDGKSNEEILRLMNNCSVVKDIPRIVVKLTDFSNARSLKRNLKSGCCPEPLQM